MTADEEAAAAEMKRLKVEASPTKEFFIYMLVRDVPLLRAVLDLVDNAVDGASRRGTADYSGYWINLDIKPDRFTITDNCGGIEVDVARTYAFRFGRPPGVHTAPGTIGQFGVGMKRSIFKLGGNFRVTSSREMSRFIVEEDVGVWLAKPNEWDFTFKELVDGQPQPAPHGTTIEVWNLHDAVRSTVELDTFRTQLLEEISTAHALVIEHGLVVKVNGVAADKRVLRLVTGPEIRPAMVETTLGAGADAVRVRLYAGVAEERSLLDGGWYIFCNGRMVLEADQSHLTGWGKGRLMPKYHPDFAYFRGYAFFDAENPSLLPWTTTKTGVDEDSPIYKAARQQMITVAKPVTEFLRRLAAEKHRKEHDGVVDTPLDDAYRASKPVSYATVSPERVFVAPAENDVRPPPQVRHIQYDKPVGDVDRVMQSLGAHSYREVGEKTFDYYFQLECQ